MITLRSVIARLATMIRCAGIVYTVAQVALWHSFYAGSAWRLAAPALAVAWAVTVIVYLRRHWPSPSLACADSAFYVALALGAQAGVPSAVGDHAFSWLIISMSGQLIVPAWYAPGALSVPLALSLPLACWGGAALQGVTDARTLAGSVILLVVVALVHGGGRRALYGRAVAADADLASASQAAERHYAILCRDIERREHERLLHDTVLNTLTATARSDGGAGVVTRCRQDVALIEAALAVGDPAGASARPPTDLRGEVGAVVADMRARGLAVHLEAGDGEQAAVPVRVIGAMANAVREALSNVAEHAGTGEAWVSVCRTPPEDAADFPCRVRVVVRDKGAGFDPARVNEERLGLRKSITERAAECGGQASIRSAPGQGTEVCLTWPAPGLPDAGPLAGQALSAQGPPW
jgi:signal transduction histidine kinase